jgi:hypothetical protein
MAILMLIEIIRGHERDGVRCRSGGQKIKPDLEEVLPQTSAGRYLVEGLRHPRGAAERGYNSFMKQVFENRRRAPSSMEFQETERLVPRHEKLFHRPFRGSASALAALMIFPSGAVMSLDMNKNARRPTPATSSHEAPKSAFKRKSLGPGNYYLNIIVYCRDSNEMRTFFCFWITN